MAVARFEIIRGIKLLNLKALNEVACDGSIFDSNYADRLERAAFLRHLAGLLALPVLPNRERFEYLPTQAIADYLASRAAVPLDGILFPSMQAGPEGINMVLFHKASRVQEIDLPEGTEIKTLGKAGEGYTVWEEIPPEEKEEISAGPIWTNPIKWFDDPGQPVPDYRNPTLRVELDQIKVFQVLSVHFETEDYAVSRHRQKKW